MSSFLFRTFYEVIIVENSDVHAPSQGHSAPSKTSVSGFVRAVTGLDLLLCLALIGLAAYIANKLYLEKDRIFVEDFSIFSNLVMAAAVTAGLFGMIGNLLIQVGRPLGARFAWYKVGLSVGLMCVLGGIAYHNLPNKDVLMSTANREVATTYGSAMGVFLLWTIIDASAIAAFTRANRRGQ